MHRIVEVAWSDSSDSPQDNVSLPSTRACWSASLDASTTRKSRAPSRLEQHCCDTGRNNVLGAGCLRKCVVTATFREMTDTLIVEGVAELQLSAAAGLSSTLPRPLFPIPSATPTMNGPTSGLTVQQHKDPVGRLRAVDEGIRPGHANRYVESTEGSERRRGTWIQYQSRNDEGMQSPTETLDRGWGSCRDFAVLFVEAARSLGFGARIVSGYLYQPNQLNLGCTDAGSTHPWAEVYVPGARWISFDPTNRSVGV